MAVRCLGARNAVDFESPIPYLHPWQAPEQLIGLKCTAKADIYSYGLVLWVRLFFIAWTPLPCPHTIAHQAAATAP